MLKPASSNCNLRCKYCFYNSLSECREMPSHGMMSYETLDCILDKAFSFANGDNVMLVFQGGEPLLIGKDFFRHMHKSIQRYNIKKSNVYIGVQTNGTLIDEEWCQIFKRGNYLIGLSLDGDEIANEKRIDVNGNPVFNKVLDAAKMLQKHKVKFNILSVLSKQVALRIEDIYYFFTKQGFKNIQFIPMLKPLKLDKNNNVIYSTTYTDPFPSQDEDFSLSSSDYEYFLKHCFKLYKKDIQAHKYTSIRFFDNLVQIAHNNKPEQCGLEGHCNHQFVIEADGEVYPCDFFCLDAFSMGNINDTDFHILSVHPIALNFILDSLKKDEKCKSCEYFKYCQGGCKREKIDIDKCDAYKSFLKEAIPHLIRMS